MGVAKTKGGGAGRRTTPSDDADAGGPSLRRIGAYDLISPLGSGSFATVYLARHSDSGQEFAVKVLNPEGASDPAIRERFVREGRICEILRHRHLVRAHEVLDLDTNAAIVMDKIDGGTLRDWLERNRRNATPMEVRSVATAVLSALAHAHRAGTVHRDIKPENILLRNGAGASLDPVLADFGIAKLRGELQQSIGARSTVHTTRMGTYVYMAPEHLRCDEIDHRADQYSLAVVLIEMLTGKVPYEHVEGDRLLRLERAVDAGGYGLPEEHHAVDARLAIAIERAINVNPGDRWPDCDAFASGLVAELPRPTARRETRAETPVAIAPTEVTPTAAALAARPLHNKLPPRISEPPAAQGWFAPIAVGLAVVSAIAALAVAQTTSPPPATTPPESPQAATAVPSVPTVSALPTASDDPVCAGLAQGEYRGVWGPRKVLLQVPTCVAHGTFEAPAGIGERTVSAGMASCTINGDSVTLDFHIDESTLDRTRLEGKVVAGQIVGDGWLLQRAP
ncbi:hypothetical protein LBMAG42_54790 [Deltaproteobacteria bacterium]|nr:hypothetical protein LBMAG42_54790 [Deltaproteobacteria bacterium]